MGNIDEAGEWLRLSERYRGMTDGELIAIARDRGKLTEIAQQVLANELSARGLKLEPATGRADLEGRPYSVRPTHDDPYAKDRELVEILTVWSLRDALQVQHLLDRASIPFYMGAEKATGADAVTSNFAPGVSVKVMRVGVPWAQLALSRYEPKDVPESEKQRWDEGVDVWCPSCRSQEIVFEELKRAENSPSHIFKWTCGLCGYEWEDDGVAKDV